MMAVSQSIRNKARSGRVVRFEPHDLELINEDPKIRASFEQAGCMHFYERI
jgi:recombinational DNA repair ATPase RecF